MNWGTLCLCWCYNPFSEFLNGVVLLSIFITLTVSNFTLTHFFMVLGSCALSLSSTSVALAQVTFKVILLDY